MSYAHEFILKKKQIYFKIVNSLHINNKFFYKINVFPKPKFSVIFFTVFCKIFLLFDFIKETQSFW